jgi:hypothetical protein
VAIPRSTVSTWRRRGHRPIVTIEPFDQDRQQLVDTIAKLDRRAHILAAIVRILLALLRASSFTFAGERLHEGAAKAGILRAITSAKPFLPLAVILRVVHLEPRRYHTWNRASTAACGLNDRSSCPRTSPRQLTPTEVADIKAMVLAPEKRHMSLRTLAMHVQRIGKVFASATTWAKLVRTRGWLRPRKRVHPLKPIVGVRAAAPNDIWHVDREGPKPRRILRRAAQYPDAIFGLRRPYPGRDVFRHVGRLAGATVSGPDQGTEGAPCSEPGDDLRPVQRSANQLPHIADSSMVSALPLLRTPFYGRSAHTAVRHAHEGRRDRACFPPQVQTKSSNRVGNATPIPSLFPHSE